MSETIEPITKKSGKRTVFISLRTKLIAGLAVLVLISFAALYVWLDNFVTNMMMQNLRRDLLATAETAAAGINGDEHTNLFLHGQIDDATYTQIANWLRSVKATNPKASGVYTYVQVPGETDRVHFVVSAALPPGSTAAPTSHKSGTLSDCQIPPSSRPALGEAYTWADGLSPTMLAGVKEPGVETQLWSDQWGTWLSGYAPIYNSADQPVGAVGVDMCAANVIQLQNNVRRSTLLVFGGALLLLIIVVGLVAASVTRPVLQLTNLADRIGGGDYDLDFSKLYSTRVQDEVDKLANVFELMVGKVHTREQALRARVAQLEIMIDHSKLETQVQEIVDSDFFQDLRSKVQDMRSRFKDQPPTNKEEKK